MRVYFYLLLYLFDLNSQQYKLSSFFNTQSPDTIFLLHYKDIFAVYMNDR